MLRIYRNFWQVTWAEQWQYRASLLMYLLFWVVSPVVYLAVWSAVAGAQGKVAGFSAADFRTYYLTLVFVDVLTSEITIHVLAYRVYDGTLASDLLRPVHPVLTGVLTYNLAFKALTLIALVPLWLLLCLLVHPDFSTVTLGSLLLAIPAIVLGFAISFLFGASVTCIAFWTQRAYSLTDLYYAVVILLSGQFVPLDLLPGPVRAVALFLPFQLFRYFPVQLILGRLSPAVIAREGVLALSWLVVALALFRWIWRTGLKHFSAVGA